MDLLRARFQGFRAGPVLLACALASTFLSLTAPPVQGQKAEEKTLHIGNSGTLTTTKENGKEKGAIDSLKDFIKTETGMQNEIIRRKGWDDLAEGMNKGEMQLGVFQGYEFAWAQAKNPNLKPLALAVNIYRYPVAYVLAKNDNAAKDFAGLQGQTLCLPDTGQRYLRLYVDRQAEMGGKKTDAFFSKITVRDNVEDAIDEVVDGNSQVTVIDQAGMEAYKRRKPGRFKQLKEIAHSQPFAPVVIAYQDKSLDDATLKRFKDGLLRADKSDRGQTMLTTFKLSGFEAVPDDFNKVLGEIRKDYPPR
jgi:ABC-type phosphate/phosphonate transport system substrate-binding protein